MQESASIVRNARRSKNSTKKNIDINSYVDKFHIHKSINNRPARTDVLV